MMFTRATARIPGRARFAGVFDGGAATLVALFGAGVLVTSFTRLESWRELLLGGAPSSPAAIVMLLLTLAALAWWPFSRRTAVWAEPAVLTWRDFSGADRVRAISIRVWSGWLSRLLALGYVTVFLGALTELPADLWLAATVPVVSGVPALLIAAGGVPGKPLRLPVAVTATRTALVAGWAQRVVRSVSVVYLDPMMMLPAARPIAPRPLNGDVVLRLAALGILARAQFVVPFLLLAVLTVCAHVALPGVPDTMLVGVLGFAALVPFAGGIGELRRSPGLRRWIDGPDLSVRLRFAVVVGGLGVVWGFAVLVLVTFAGAPLTASAWLVLPLTAGTVLRCATRPQIDYDNIGPTDTPFGQVPVGLVVQLVRGPAVGVVGMVLLTVLPFAWFTCVFALLFTAWCIRT